MDRRAFITMVGGSIIAGPLAAEAQPADKVYRMGYLYSGSATSSPRAPEAFLEGLRELGWVQGRNIVIDYRFAEGRFDRLPDLAAELVRRKVDVFVAWPTPPAIAAKNATATILIVMIGVGYPVELGLVTSLARPGANVTGLSFNAGEEIGKGLELLQETLPQGATCGDPFEPGQSRPRARGTHREGFVPRVRTAVSASGGTRARPGGRSLRGNGQGPRGRAAGRDRLDVNFAASAAC